MRAWALREAIAGEGSGAPSDSRVTNSEGATWARGARRDGVLCDERWVLLGGYRGSWLRVVLRRAALCDDATDPAEPPRSATATGGRPAHFARQARAGAEQVGCAALRRIVMTLVGRRSRPRSASDRARPGSRVARSSGPIFLVANGSSVLAASRAYLVGKEGEVKWRRRSSPIVDDPLIARVLPVSRPFDGDGLATRKNHGRSIAGMLEALVLYRRVLRAQARARVAPASAGRGIGGETWDRRRRTWCMQLAARCRAAR